MANGKPGDHPLTDILHYGSSEYGEPVDGLVKELARHPGFAAVRSEVADLLLDCSPIGKHGDRAAFMAKALERLQAIKAQLEDER